MSEDTPTEVTSEEGNQIPVRYEGNYPTYTDEHGRHLQTGEYIGPASTLVGENYEHNPEKAHAMSLASDQYRTEAATMRSKADEDRFPGASEHFTSEAGFYDRKAAHEEKKAGEQYDDENDVIGQTQTEQVRPKFEKHFEDREGFIFLGHVEIGENGSLGDAYIHDQRAQHPDWPKLTALAMATRTGNEEENYGYIHLDTYAGANGWELYTKGWPVFGQEGVRVQTRLDQELRLAMEKGIVSEDDLLKTISHIELRRLDDETQQRVIRAHGFNNLEEWEASEEAKYKAAREAEAKEKGYSTVEELEQAEDERFRQRFKDGPPVLLPPLPMNNPPREL